MPRRNSRVLVKSSPRIALRVALGLQATCVASVGLYAVMRVVQAASAHEPDPARVVAWSAHAGYFWRAWTVSYAGAMVGFLAFAAARTRDAKVARGLVVALTVAVVLIVVQGVFVP